MLNSKISSGVIGLGNIGLLYDLKLKKTLTYSKALSKNNKYKLEFACDPAKKKLELFTKRYGVKGFKYITDALKKYNPDLIVICSNTESHYAIFNKIIKIYKPKALIIEKPFTDNYRQALKIFKFCKKNKIKLFSNYTRTINPVFLKIKKTFFDHNYKKFKFVFYYSGKLINNGAHFIDLMIYLLGYPENFKIIKKRKDYIDVDIFYKNGYVQIKNTKFCNKKENFCYYDLGSNRFMSNNKYFKYNNRKINLKSDKYQTNLLNLVYKSFKSKLNNYEEIKKNIKVLKLINLIQKNEI